MLVQVCKYKKQTMASIHNDAHYPSRSHQDGDDAPIKPADLQNGLQNRPSSTHLPRATAIQFTWIGNFVWNYPLRWHYKAGLTFFDLVIVLFRTSKKCLVVLFWLFSCLPPSQMLVLGWEVVVAAQLRNARLKFRDARKCWLYLINNWFLLDFNKIGDWWWLFGETSRCDKF